MKENINNNRIDSNINYDYKNGFINFDDEINKNYINYSTNIIIARTIPDVRDGLKPVHRRILFTMYKMKNLWYNSFIKSARVVGEVMGKFHPHGDSSIYNSLVRMTQVFSLRFPLIEGQGNFGSIDGDNAAAMRYTECRLSKNSIDLFTDIDENIIEFINNYDGTEKEPIILPVNIPNLLINGTSGIGVGLTTNIPPHNIIESINAILFLIKNPKLTINDLIKIIPAPDFPTGGVIENLKNLHNAYLTGKGNFIIKSKYTINGQNIIINDLPYQVTKNKLLESIINIIKKKKILGINNIIDESNGNIIKIIFNIKNGFNIKNILNKLYESTQLKIKFNINMICLVNYKPKLLNLKQILEQFIIHKKTLLLKKINNELIKLKHKKHILYGFILTISNIDNIIKIIKNFSKTKKIKQKLKNMELKSNIFSNKIKKKKNIKLSNIQINNIFKTNLYKLNKNNKKRILSEYSYSIKNIIYLSLMLIMPDKINLLIYNELYIIRNKYKKDIRNYRLTKIIF